MYLIYSQSINKKLSSHLQKKVYWKNLGMSLSKTVHNNFHGYENDDDDYVGDHGNLDDYETGGNQLNWNCLHLDCTDFLADSMKFGDTA